MFTWLLYGTLCALPLALLALLARWMKAAPALEHALWVLVIVRLVFPPMPDVAALLGRGSASTGGSSPSTPAIVSAEEPSWGDVAVAWTTRRLGSNWSNEMRRWATVLFVAGVLALFLRELRRVRWVDRRLRRARGAPSELVRHLREVAASLGVSAPEVRVLSETASPFVWSLRSPVLVLPETRELQVPSVLAHELAHIARRDPWTAWLELVVGALHFWNPLFWLARARMRHAAELACDDWVVARFPAERRSYASALVDAAQRASIGLSVPRAVHAIGTDRHGFEERLRRILAGKSVPRAPRTAFVAAAALALATLPGAAAPSLAAFRGALPVLPAGLDRTEWEESLARADARLAEEPDDGAAHLQRGVALSCLQRSAEAIAAFERQAELGFQPGKAFYNIACVHARAGATDDALACLEEAVSQDFTIAEIAPRDPDLESLRDLPAFQALVAGNPR